MGGDRDHADRWRTWASGQEGVVVQARAVGGGTQAQAKCGGALRRGCKLSGWGSAEQKLNLIVSTHVVQIQLSINMS